MMILKLRYLAENQAEIFDMLSGARGPEPPPGLSRTPGRCQSPHELEKNHLGFSFNENSTLHYLTAGIFYNTFPEDFSLLAVVRLPGENIDIVVF